MPLSCVIPIQFEHYVKVLHRLDAHYENIDHPLEPSERAILGIPDSSPVRELVVRLRNSPTAPRIFWQEAAAAFNLPYCGAIKWEWFHRYLEPYKDGWYRHIYGPNEGSLAPDECAELIELLKAETHDTPCWFRLAEIPYIATDQVLLHAGRLDEVRNYFLCGSFQSTPEYWWPEDHSWCVASDYDLDFTVVGCNASVAESLQMSRTLECIEVDPGIRVDYLTPIPSSSI